MEKLTGTHLGSQTWRYQKPILFPSFFLVRVWNTSRQALPGSTLKSRLKCFCNRTKPESSPVEPVWPSVNKVVVKNVQKAGLKIYTIWSPTATRFLPFEKYLWILITQPQPKNHLMRQYDRLGSEQR